MSKISSSESIVKRFSLSSGSGTVQGPAIGYSASVGKPKISQKGKGGAWGFARFTLDNSLISFRKNPVLYYELYARALRIVRNNGRLQRVGGGIKKEISRFSESSKRLLKFTAANAMPALVSWMGLTYHNVNPSGRQAKKDLYKFLLRLARKYPGCGYLWVIEFQRRGFIHFHIWLTLNHETPGLRRWMVENWNDIVAPGDRKHLTVQGESKNFKVWEMGSGSYACKYLDKARQKEVPEGFGWVGRFWGCSRNLVPDPAKVAAYKIDQKYSYERLDEETGEVENFKASAYVLRGVCKCHEKQLKKYRSPYASRARKGGRSYLLQSGGLNFRKMLSYLEEEAKKRRRGDL